MNTIYEKLKSIITVYLPEDVEVNDIKHLRNIIGALRATPVITSVERARG